MENHVLKNFFKAAWVALLFLCCQLAAAAPTASISATPNSPTAPATVTLAVTVTPDAEPVTITQVEYFSGNSSLEVVLQAPYSLTLSNLAAGTYQISAKVTTTDPNNPVLQSVPLSVTVGNVPGAASAYFIHTDQLNTPRVITSAGGAPVWQWDSEPFGKDAANEQPTGQPVFVFSQRFPGQQFDRESNLHYNYFRDYDPALGRYIQSDPIGLRGGINTYLYVMGNPLRGFDPYGLADASTIMCDGNGNYVVVNNDKGPASGCTQIHEQSHIRDWVDRYGKNSCVGKPAGYLPTSSVNGDNYRDFLRDSECRAFEAEKSCVQKCNDPVETKRWQRGFEKNYCESYSSWKKR